MKSAIKEKRGKWEVFYNTNRSAASRGLDRDEPNKKVTFGTDEELLNFLADESVISEEIAEDGVVDIDQIMDDVEMIDVSGGFTVIFSIKNLKTGEVYTASWDPTDFEYEDDDEDDDTEFMNDLRAGYRKEDEGYTRFLSADNETQVANVVKVFGDSPEFKEAYDKYLETRHWNPNPYSHFSFGDAVGRQRYENWEAGWRIAKWDLDHRS